LILGKSQVFSVISIDGKPGTTLTINKIPFLPDSAEEKPFAT
jgi:hypothetical protein